MGFAGSQPLQRPLIGLPSGSSPMAPAIVVCRCHAPQRRTRVAAKKEHGPPDAPSRLDRRLQYIFLSTPPSRRQVRQTNAFFSASPVFPAEPASLLAAERSSARQSYFCEFTGRLVFGGHSILPSSRALCCLHFRDRSALRALGPRFPRPPPVTSSICQTIAEPSRNPRGTIASRLS